ncbi:hypothetical protein D9757_008826 [Collybiopsis confluens]|uniref:Uncharacterized protein n=1 Tax=Collybiopsis confluens TaxID=2823264 RepID=A0A8H5H3C3_9AGAR|nr:hypothetical protein D9757_008826 [Collybiopsis confluens]
MSVAVAGTHWPGGGPGVPHPSSTMPGHHTPHHLNPHHQDPTLAPRNAVDLTREMLIAALEHLSTMIAFEFSGLPIRLVAHGGACMLLHPGLHELANRKAMYHSTRGENAPRRTTTRDVDYIHRAFVAESDARGIISAGERLQRCIRTTARQFGLGADWMNSDADVALPMSTDPGTGAAFDPIYTESVKENNVQLYTVFTSSNGLLTIVNVTPFWAVALKLVRYTKWDPGDICLLLLFGSVARGVKWTADNLEGWIRVNCSAMNYHNWDSTKTMDMRQKIAHAIALISSIGPSIMAQPGKPLLPPFHSASGGATSTNITTTTPSSGGQTLKTRSSRMFSASDYVPGSSGFAPTPPYPPLPPPDHHAASSSTKAVTATAIGWAGPASDAAMAAGRKSETLNTTTTSLSTQIEKTSYTPRSYEPVKDGRSNDGRSHSLSNPRYIVPTDTPTNTQRPSRHPSSTDLKKEETSRTRRRDMRIQERERILRRRLKFMLRADEPDDSDVSQPSDLSNSDIDTEDGGSGSDSDSELESDSDSGLVREENFTGQEQARAPFIPVIPVSNDSSIPTNRSQSASSSSGLWNSTPSVYPPINRSWTQMMITEEPTSMAPSLSLSLSELHLPSVSESDRRMHMHPHGRRPAAPQIPSDGRFASSPGHSNSWPTRLQPITRHPPPRHLLVSPLLEPPARTQVS